MYQRLSAPELRCCLKLIYCDQLLFGCGAPPSANDLFNAHYGMMDMFSTEFCTAIQSIGTVWLKPFFFFSKFDKKECCTHWIIHMNFQRMIFRQMIITEFVVANRFAQMEQRTTGMKQRKISAFVRTKKKMLLLKWCNR